MSRLATARKKNPWLRWSTAIKENSYITVNHCNKRKFLCHSEPPLQRKIPMLQWTTATKKILCGEPSQLRKITLFWNKNGNSKLTKKTYVQPQKNSCPHVLSLVLTFYTNMVWSKNMLAKKMHLKNNKKNNCALALPMVEGQNPSD